MSAVQRVFPLLLAALSLASAQSLTSVAGTVSDPTGAVIGAAAVELENVDTQARRATEADAAGRYQFLQIPPGNYKLTVKAAGFQSKAIDGVRLLVNSPATVNVALEVGQVTESVEVSALSVQINTTDATIGNAFGTNPILQLPFEGRNVVGLLSLQPGVAFIGEGVTDSRNGAVNGGRSDQANVTLDGVDVNEQQERSAFTSVLRVTLDSVQEFRVTTTNANADQGRSSGAQIALVTKSGTNQTHGSFYHFHRNTVTTANSFFNNAARPAVARPKLIRNIFGASVGGPVKKNRLFYFFNYEGRRDAKDGSVERVVPTAEYRQGIVRYQRTNGSVATLTPGDVRSLDPLGVGANAEVLKVFQSYPLPNSFTSGDGLNTGGFRFIAPLPVRWNTWIARLDYNLTESGQHAVFLRGNLQNDNEKRLPQFPGEPANQTDLANNKGLAAGYNATLRPNLIGAFRYGFTRQGIENSGLQTQSALTFFGIADRFGLTTPFIRITPVHHTTQDMTWSKGAHNVQFGATQRWIANNRTSYANSYHTATMRASRLRGSGAALDPADIARGGVDAFRNNIVNLLGLISSATARYNYDLQGNVAPVGAPVVRGFNGREYELYVQDTWRATRSLTLTAGLRWSLMPPIYEANGLQVSTEPGLGAWFNTRSAAAEQGRPMNSLPLVQYIAGGDSRPLYAHHKKNFAPRFALAWSPSSTDGMMRRILGAPGRTSIRAGWGMFYDLFGQSLMRSSDANSFGLQTGLESAGSLFTEATAPRFTGLFNIPASLVPPPPRGGLPQQAPTTFARGRGIDPFITPPYAMNMNLTMSREFDHGFFVQIGYVGRLGRRALIQPDLASPVNFKDPQSGQFYWDAASQMAGLVKANTPVGQVGPIPFFESLWPAAAGNGLTATQRIYNQYRRGAPGDYVTVLEDLDRFCGTLSATVVPCSRFGSYTFFDRQFASFPTWQSRASSSYHALQMTLRKSLSQGVQFDFNYTWSKSQDLGSRAEGDGFGNLGIIPNPWNVQLRKAVSDYDMTHQWNANWVAELPFGKGKKWLNRGGAAHAIVGGWQLGGLYRHTTGLPISVANGRSWPTSWEWQANATQIGLFPEPRTSKNAPAIAGPGGPNLFADPARVFAAYDYTNPGGIGQRNGIRGDGFFTIDMNVGKRFVMPYSEKHSVQFRWEVFNVTNTVRFDVRSTNLQLTAQGPFGKYSDTLTPPRVMQFGLRYEY